MSVQSGGWGHNQFVLLNIHKYKIFYFDLIIILKCSGLSSTKHPPFWELELFCVWSKEKSTKLLGLCCFRVKRDLFWFMEKMVRKMSLVHLLSLNGSLYDVCTPVVYWPSRGHSTPWTRHLAPPPVRDRMAKEKSMTIKAVRCVPRNGHCMVWWFYHI